MKLTTGILVLGMAVATAWGQNPGRHPKHEGHAEGGREEESKRLERGSGSLAGTGGKIARGQQQGGGETGSQQAWQQRRGLRPYGVAGAGRWQDCGPTEGRTSSHDGGTQSCHQAGRTESQGRSDA